MVSERDAADFGRRRDAERASHNRKTTTKQVSDAVLQSLNRAADRIEKGVHPLEAKQRLANCIVSRVKCPHFDRVCANRAAEYVIFDGLPLAVMGKLLDELDDADHRGKVREWEEGRGGGRGGWFNGVLKIRLSAHNIPERKKRADK